MTGLFNNNNNNSSNSSGGTLDNKDSLHNNPISSSSSSSLSTLIHSAANGRFNTTPSASPIMSAILIGGGNPGNTGNPTTTTTTTTKDQVPNFSLPTNSNDDLLLPNFNFNSNGIVTNQNHASPISTDFNDNDPYAFVNQFNPTSSSSTMKIQRSEPLIQRQDRRASLGTDYQKPLTTMDTDSKRTSTIPEDTTTPTTFSYANPFQFLEMHQNDLVSPKLPPSPTKKTTNPRSVSPTIKTTLPTSSSPINRTVRNPMFVLADDTASSNLIDYQAPSPKSGLLDTSEIDYTQRFPELMSPASTNTSGVLSLLSTPQIPPRKKSRDQQRPLVPTNLSSSNSPSISGPSKIIKSNKDKGKSKLKHLKPTMEPTRILPSPKTSSMGSHHQKSVLSVQDPQIEVPGSSSAFKQTELANIQDSIMQLIQQDPSSLDSTTVYSVPLPSRAPGALIPKYRNSSLFRPVSFVCKSLQVNTPYMVPFTQQQCPQSLLAQGPDGLQVAFVEKEMQQDSLTFPEPASFVVHIADLSLGSVCKHSFTLEEPMVNGPDYPVCITMSSKYVAVACKSGRIRVLAFDKDSVQEHMHVFVNIPVHMTISHMRIIPSSMALVVVVQSIDGFDSGCLLHIQLCASQQASTMNVSLLDRSVSTSLKDVTKDGFESVSDIELCKVDLYYTLVTDHGTVCIYSGLDLIKVFTLEKVFFALNQSFSKNVVGLCNPIVSADAFVFMVATRDGKIVQVNVPRLHTQSKIVARVVSALKLPLGSVVSGIMSDGIPQVATDVLSLPNGETSPVKVWVPYHRPCLNNPSKVVNVLAAVHLDTKIQYKPTSLAMFLLPDSNALVRSVSMQGILILVATDLGIQYAKANNLAKIAEWVSASVAFPRVLKPVVQPTLAVAMTEPDPHTLTVQLKRELVKVGNSGTQAPGSGNDDRIRAILQAIDQRINKISEQLDTHQAAVAEVLANPVRSASPVKLNTKEITSQVIKGLEVQIHQLVLDRVGQMVRDAATRVITDSLVPAYERATREMFCQLADTFQTGIHGIVQQVQHELGPAKPMLSQSMQQINTKKSHRFISSADESEANITEPEFGVSGISGDDDEDDEGDELFNGKEPLTSNKVDQLVMQNKWDQLFRLALSDQANAVHVTLDIVSKFSPPKELGKLLTQAVIYGIIVTISSDITQFAGRSEILDARVPWLVTCAQAINTANTAMIEGGMQYLKQALTEINQTEQLLKQALQSGSRSPHLPSLRLLDRILRAVVTIGEELL